MPFSEVIAQERAVSALRAALRRGALHHAYLFGGPPGTGKAHAARLLAQAANCEAASAQAPPEEAGSARRRGEGEARAIDEEAGSARRRGEGEARAIDDPCGACRSCRKIAAENHPDVLWLREERVMTKAGRWEPRGGRTPSKDIVVDQIRDLVDHRLAMKRFEGRRRFVVIDPADAMNPQAQNALLKTLEEPPDETTLVLVAGSPDSLLPTIRSRCLRVAFQPIPDALVIATLEAEGRSPAEARLASALAGGSLGRARALEPAELDALHEAVRSAAGLDPEDALGWLAFARDHGGARAEAAAVCELLAVWLRDVLAAQAGGGSPALLDLAGETARAAAALTPAEVVRRREEVTATVLALGQNASPVLALERLFIRWFSRWPSRWEHGLVQG